MLSNLLSWFKVNPGEGAFYSVFGFCFVFLGIVILIGIIALVGYIMTKWTDVREKKKATKVKSPSAPVQEAVSAIDEGIPPEVVAAITAALAVCMQEEKAKCDFVVRRIRKI